MIINPPKISQHCTYFSSINNADNVSVILKLSSLTSSSATRLCRETGPKTDVGHIYENMPNRDRARRPRVLSQPVILY